MFIAPTEPSKLRDIGVTSMLSEEYGADVFWESLLGKVGIQRKAFPSDFFSSATDGRLMEQVSRMQDLDVAILLIEGRQFWTADGYLTNSYREGWRKSQFQNYLIGVQMRGVMVAYTTDLDDTISFIHGFHEYSEKHSHTSLDYRPHTRRGPWDRLSNREYRSYFLQSLPQTGPKRAEGVLDALGFPFTVSVPWEEFLEVPGIGPAWVDRVRKVFEGEDDEEH